MNIPKANKELIEQANKFLFDTELYHTFSLFCAREMIGKELLHSDRWSMVYDWLEDQGIEKPEGIETALTEWFETMCIHIKKIVTVMNRKIWVAIVNMDSVEIEYEWDSVEDLQKDWCSEECPCPCGDDEVLAYSIDGLVQDTHTIKENKYGYKDFSSLLDVLGVKGNS